MTCVYHIIEQRVLSFPNHICRCCFLVSVKITKYITTGFCSFLVHGRVLFTLDLGGGFNRPLESSLKKVVKKKGSRGMYEGGMRPRSSMKYLSFFYFRGFQLPLEPLIFILFSSFHVLFGNESTLCSIIL